MDNLQNDIKTVLIEDQRWFQSASMFYVIFVNVYDSTFRIPRLAYVIMSRNSL